jgi:hypothetical protein
MAEKALEMEEAADLGRMGRTEVLLEKEQLPAFGMEWM